MVLGTVFSATMMAGPFWVVQLTVHRGFSSAIAAAVAVAMAQAFWGAVAWLILTALYPLTVSWDPLLRVAAALILGAMGLRVLSGQKAESLAYDGPVRGIRQAFTFTWTRALAMPMRLAGYLAFFTALSAHLRPRPLSTSLPLGMGVGLGALAWLLFFVLVAKLAEKQVTEEIYLHSLNKLRVLALAVFAGLFVIGLAPLAPGFR